MKKVCLVFFTLFLITAKVYAIIELSCCEIIQFKKDAAGFLESRDFEAQRKYVVDLYYLQNYKLYKEFKAHPLNIEQNKQYLEKIKQNDILVKNIEEQLKKDTEIFFKKYPSIYNEENLSLLSSPKVLESEKELKLRRFLPIDDIFDFAIFYFTYYNVKGEDFRRLYFGIDNAKQADKGFMEEISKAVKSPYKTYFKTKAEQISDWFYFNCTKGLIEFFDDLKNPNHVENMPSEVEEFVQDNRLIRYKNLHGYTKRYSYPYKGYKVYSFEYEKIRNYNKRGSACILYKRGKVRFASDKEKKRIHTFSLNRD